MLEFSSAIMSLILAGKVGSNIASEIGTMRITEQIDAMEIMGTIRVNVEYEGKGRVVAQSPMPEEALQKGTVCKLTLKERG